LANEVQRGRNDPPWPASGVLCVGKLVGRKGWSWPPPSQACRFNRLHCPARGPTCPCCRQSFPPPRQPCPPDRERFPFNRQNSPRRGL